MQHRLNCIAFILLAGILGSAVLYGCSKKADKEQIKLLEKITFCQGGNTPVQVFIADENGDFTQEGLEGVVRKLGDGKSALNAVLAGDCTFGAGIGDPPIVTQSYARNDFVVLGSLENSGNFARIVARKDRGITRAEELKGKRLGVKQGVASHIFAEHFLKKHGLTSADLEIRFMEQKDMPDAVAVGDIDAASCSDGYALDAIRKLGSNAVILEEPGLLIINSYLVAKKDTVAQKPESVKKMLRALLRAEKLIISNPSEAAAKLAVAMSVPPDEAAKIITQRKHALSLSSVQLHTLEQNSSWMMANGMLQKSAPNNFRTLIDERFLKELSPAAVALEK